MFELGVDLSRGSMSASASIEAKWRNQEVVNLRRRSINHVLLPFGLHSSSSLIIPAQALTRTHLAIQRLVDEDVTRFGVNPEVLGPIVEFGRLQTVRYDIVVRVDRVDGHHSAACTTRSTTRKGGGRETCQVLDNQFKVTAQLDLPTGSFSET